MKKLLLVGAGLLAMLPMTASARGFRGGFYGGPRFAPYGWYGGGFYGPGFWPYGYGFYGPGPYYYANPNIGKLKFETDVKDAEVYINGSYAGTVGKLKTMELRPGSYNIELRAPGRPTYAERVYIAAGKTLKIRPEMRLQATP